MSPSIWPGVLLRVLGVVVTWVVVLGGLFVLLAQLPDAFDIARSQPVTSSTVRARAPQPPALVRFDHWWGGAPLARDGVRRLRFVVDDDALAIDDIPVGPAVPLTVTTWMQTLPPALQSRLRRETARFAGVDDEQLAFAVRRAAELDPVTSTTALQLLQRQWRADVTFSCLHGCRIADDVVRLDDDIGYVQVAHAQGPFVISVARRGTRAPPTSVVSWAPLHTQLGCASVTSDALVDGLLTSTATPVVLLQCDGRPHVVVVEDAVRWPPPRGPGVVDALAGRDRRGWGRSSSGALVADVLWGVDAICGDGQRDALEQCDDGNLVDGDGCDASCGTAHVDVGKRWATSSSRVVSTLTLMLPSLLLALALAFGTAGWSALRRNQRSSRAIDQLSSTMAAVPSLVWALMLLFGVGVGLGWAPTQATLPSPTSTASTTTLVGQRLAGLWLPWLCLSSLAAARYTRLLRPAFLDAAQTLPCVAARARGASDVRVVFVHAGRQVLPLFAALTVVALPQWLGGALLVETVFAVPGLGRLLYDAVLAGDHHVVMVVVLLLVVVTTVCTEGGRLASTALDPRLRASSTGTTS